MKKTEKELMKMTLEELGFEYAELGDKPIIEHVLLENEFFYVKDLGIEIIPEQPEITVKNLGKFMAMYKTYPEARFKNEAVKSIKGTIRRLQYLSDNTQHPYGCDGGIIWPECRVTDSRWPCIAEDHETCELCKDARMMGNKWLGNSVEGINPIVIRSNNDAREG